MRVLITGATGFVGRRLARSLAARGDEVTGASSESAKLEGVESLNLDLLDTQALGDLAKRISPDVVVHLAGLASVGRSWTHPADYFKVNVLGTENLLDAFPETKLLFASSAEVYGVVPEAEQPLSEDRVPAPGNPYALTKAAAERLVLASGGTVMRFFTLVGAGQSRRFALPSFAEQLAELRCSGGGRMKVGNLSARRDFLHVDDAIGAMTALIDLELGERIYNVGGGDVVSVRQILDRLIQLSGVEAKVEVDPERMRPIDVPLQSANAKRLEALGWSRNRSLDEALQEIWLESLDAVSASG
jgi:GDP-4-dehydro-6-deoxy-D-mannose reductase